VDTTTEMLLAGTVIIIGRMTQNKGINAQTIIGIIGSAVFLSLVGQADEQLAKAFGGIVLISAVFVYGVPILQKVGLIR
jgi:hypothetical protein